jgi:signal transduction histidine kinase/CheY-like chemotaxis protein
MALAVVAWSTTVSRESRRITENMLTSVEQVSRIGRRVEQERILINDHIAVDNDAGRMAAIEQQIASVEKDLSDATESYSPLVTLPGEDAAWQRLQSDLAALHGPIGGALAFSRVNSDAEARQVLLAVNDKYTDVENDVSRLVQINRTGGQDVVKRIDELGRRTLLLFSLLGLGGFVGTLLVGRWSRLRLTESDERIRRYASELEAQNEALGNTSWVRSQHVALSTLIQGELEVEELATRSLSTLVEATGAHVGAFWVADVNGYRRVAGHALDDSAPERFGEGEGLVGQTGLDRQLRHLRDVPADFLRVRSGSGDRAPVELVLLPALADGQTQAVVELGFLRGIEKRALELMDRVSESIAVAIRSSAYRKKLGELLEESRQQAEELRVQQEELRAANEELLMQGDTLRTTGAELERINSSLELASRCKSDFLANMSHELRTPLNSALILAKLLSENASGNLNEEQVHFARTIESAGQDLLGLIDSVLDLSKIEAGKVEAHITPTSVHRLVEPVIKLFEPVARAKGLTLAASLDPSDGAVETDVQRVQQVLKNLLSNAVKFTDRGEVGLQVEETDDELSFVVRDTGVGIPESDRHVIFEAFRQGNGAQNRRFGGTGLGLSISRELARLLGGDLRLCQTDGTGSTFRLSLPRRCKATASRPVHVNGAAHAPAAAAPRVAAPTTIPDDRARLDGVRRVLLIVDDDVSFAEVLAKLAGELDFQYIVAHRADDAVQLAVQHVPSAIVLDVNLPDQSGLSVIERLKRNPVTRHIPIHVISALDQAGVALSRGAIGYVRKPVTREALIATLRRLKDHFDRPRRLLIVEDDPIERGAIDRLLDATEAQIVSVSTVADALAYLAKSTFDCVVTDLKLGEESGYDLLEKMANDDEYSFPPVIVYTGRSLTPDEEQRLLRYSTSIIIKGARSPERLLDEVTLFLHQVESHLPDDRRRMLEESRNHETPLDGKTILIAEDDVRNVFALSKVLEPNGAKVVIARNGREVLETLDATPDVDLVLMDIMMPEMDGLQAMEAIRKRGDCASRLPIIALTAKAMPDDRERCRAAGANDYVAKPLDVEVLLSLARVWTSQ